jgi:hypothetical protein
MRDLMLQEASGLLSYNTSPTTSPGWRPTQTD